MLSVGHILDYNSRCFTDKKAVVSGHHRLTYGQFNSRVDQLAWAFANLGLKKRDVCSIMLYNCQEFLEAYLATSKIGAIASPLNYRLSELEIIDIFDHAKPEALVIHYDFLEGFSRDFFDKTENIRIVVVGEKQVGAFLNYEVILNEQEARRYNPKASIDDVNMLIYTSGTTGLPKAVMITNNHVIWNSINSNMFFGFNSKDVTLAIAPLFHIAGLHDLVFPHLHIGGSVVLQQRFDPNETVALIKKEGVTNTFLVPSMYQILLESFSFERIELPSHLRMILSGASPISKNLFDEIRVKIHANFLYGYGMSEAGPNVCFLNSMTYPDKKCSIGLPLPHQFVCLVDENLNEITSYDEVGDIVIAGPTVFRGYLNNPEATSEAIVDLETDRFSGKCLLTGDLAYRDTDGFYYIVDRKKDVIISGGENVYCIEVENVLNSHPDIRESAVVGVPHEKWGEAVKAFIVPKGKRHFSSEKLNEFCRNYLGGFKVPKVYEVVNSIPRNPSGKILRNVLKDEIEYQQYSAPPVRK